MDKAVWSINYGKRLKRRGSGHSGQYAVDEIITSHLNQSGVNHSPGTMNAADKNPTK